jgi:Flp pilus assembly secretin CpaC
MRPLSYSLVALVAIPLFSTPEASAAERIREARNTTAVPAAARSDAESEAPDSGRGAPGDVSVVVDRAKIIRLPERTQTVVVGNPGIADVTLQRNGIVVLTGKSYGLTNLIALDAAGNMLAESTVRVQAPTEALVVVQRGLERESYSCTPRCQPSIVLGDSGKYFGDAAAQAGAHNSVASQR